MTDAWSPEDLERVEAADELEIAVRRPDGTLRKAVPIWVVCFEGQVFVRTWYRRGTGWFGRVLDSGRAQVRLPGVEADVAVEDVGAGTAALRAGVDAAYRAKYGRYGDSVRPMVADEAVATTLRLIPEPP